MTKVVKYLEVVKTILEEAPASRDCDYNLYFHLLNQLDSSLLEMSLMDALHAWHKKDIPSIYSISRARRLAQEQYADIPSKKYLCGNRRGKKSLSEELSEEVINYKIEENGDSIT